MSLYQMYDDAKKSKSEPFDNHPARAVDLICTSDFPEKTSEPKSEETKNSEHYRYVHHISNPKREYE